MAAERGRPEGGPRGAERPAPGVFRWVLLAVVSLLILVPLGLGLAFYVPRNARRERLERRLAAAAVDFHAQRWERPVLRGEPIEGNAVEAQNELLARANSWAPVGIGTLEEYRLSPRARAAIDGYGPQLDAYLETTQRTYSFAGYPAELGLSAPSPDRLAHLALVKLLLMRSGEQPGCLRVIADVIRLGQDRAAGDGLLGLMVHSATTEMALSVAEDCIARSSDAELRQAARELAILVEHPAPTGYAFEAEAIFFGAASSEMLESVGWFPSDRAELDAWLAMGDGLEAWGLLMGEPSERRAIGDDYPADLHYFDAIEARISELDPLFAAAMPDYGRYLLRDADTRASVRILLAGVRIQLGEAPGEVVADPSLVDPTRGVPFEVTVGPRGVELRGRPTLTAYVGSIPDTDALQLVVRRTGPPPP